jgi:short-subunit dehydrogenase
MREKNYGKILNVGSTAGFQPGPNFAVYYATKAFLNSWSQATAHELKGTGISMTLLCPGPTETEFADVAGMKKSRAFKTGAMKSFPVSKQGYEAMINGESITISGTFNKLMLQSQRFVPRSLVLNIASKLNREA